MGHYFLDTQYISLNLYCIRALRDDKQMKTIAIEPDTETWTIPLDIQLRPILTRVII